MPRNANQIFAEILEIERQIESGEAKGKLTVLKSAHRKLCREYMKAINA